MDQDALVNQLGRYPTGANGSERVVIMGVRAGKSSAVLDAALKRMSKYITSTGIKVTIDRETGCWCVYRVTIESSQRRESTNA